MHGLAHRADIINHFFSAQGYRPATEGIGHGTDASHAVRDHKPTSGCSLRASQPGKRSGASSAATHTQGTPGAVIG